jgi:hypothetical protein
MPNRHRGAGLRERLCHAEPDAAVAAGDQGDLSTEIEAWIRHAQDSTAGGGGRAR